MYKLYYLTSELDGMKPKYIGYTSKNLEDRLKGHIRDWKYKKCKSHKVNWIGNVINNGFEVKIFLIEETELIEEILILERKYIEPIFDTLVNSTNGGEESKVFSKEVIEKLSKKTKEYFKKNKHYNLGRKYKLTEEQKKERNKNLGNKTNGDKNHFFGKHHSSQTKEILKQKNAKYKQFTYDELFILYIDKKYKINEIAKLYNSTYKSVQRQLTKLNLNKNKFKNNK